VQHPVILFDGVCNLCNSSVQWVLRRDKKGTYRFAALQSERGGEILAAFGKSPATLNSIILVSEAGEIYSESGAALRIAAGLGGFWSLARVFLLIPAPLRNWVYRIVARNRYRWFGKTEACMLPSAEWKARFL
jgi:predicted DCC family thiol-disulfide oxidoreductase YuxK